MNNKVRLDVYLTSKGLVPSRQVAQRYILAGKVKDKNGKILDKPGHQVLIQSEINISVSPQFVSRGGEKLSLAFKEFPINVRNRVCMDVGISTGGFTDCLLQNGAKLIYGIDVGYGQTSWNIRNNPRVILHERTNIRYLDPSTIFPDDKNLPSFVVADLSFISLKYVLNPIRNLIKEGSLEGVFLIKPQFEVGKDFVGKGGVVKDKKHHLFALQSVINSMISKDWFINGLVASPLVGPAGNHEYLIWISDKKLINSSINKNSLEKLVENTLSTHPS